MKNHPNGNNVESARYRRRHGGPEEIAKKSSAPLSEAERRLAYRSYISNLLHKK